MARRDAESSLCGVNGSGRVEYMRRPAASMAPAPTRGAKHDNWPDDRLNKARRASSDNPRAALSGQMPQNARQAGFLVPPIHGVVLVLDDRAWPKMHIWSPSDQPSETSPCTWDDFHLRANRPALRESEELRNARSGTLIGQGREGFLVRAESTARISQHSQSTLAQGILYGDHPIKLARKPVRMYEMVAICAAHRDGDFIFRQSDTIVVSQT